jgi:Uncharacterized conserved protein, contains double-stranded beta-helix domain
MTTKHLAEHPVHLGQAGRAVAQPLMTSDPAWFAAYGARHGDDGVDGRLVTEYLFTQNWPMWERHPLGDEVVYCISGQARLRQRRDDGSEVEIFLSAGQYAINPANVWHTADIAGEARLLFITAGTGTEHEPR